MVTRFSFAAGIVFCSLLQAADPEPAGWFTGDLHVHRGICCGRSGAAEMLTPAELVRMMQPNRLNVVSVLADMGNGECRDAEKDFPLITGRDHPGSTADRILHWDAEWHFDPKGVTFEQKAIGGHLVALGLKSGERIFAEYTHPIIDWVQQQGGAAGFLHMQYLPEGIPTKLDCCAPLEYPVEVALTPGVFLVEDVKGSDRAMTAYYRLLNCGFRPGIAAGTDYPCCEKGLVPLGDLLTYVQIPEGKLDYDQWVQGITSGRTVVSRDAHNEFLDLQVNDSGPGSEIRLEQSGRVHVNAVWSVRGPLRGSLEIVQNGAVVASRKASAAPGRPARLALSLDIRHSGWICARTMGPDGHTTHTAAVFVTVGGEPVRASAGDADYFVRFIDNLLQKTSPGGEWSTYLENSREGAHARYRAARAIYVRIAEEARAHEGK